MKETEVRLKLLPKVLDKKVPDINFDLQKLDLKIDSVDSALNEILEGSDMQEFIKDTQEKNMKLNNSVMGNIKLSKELANKIEVIKNSLIKLNSH